MGKWLTFERAVTIASVICAICSVVFTIGITYAQVNSLEQRVTVLEVKAEKQAETLAEIRGDVKVLLERTKNIGQKP